MKPDTPSGKLKQHLLSFTGFMLMIESIPPDYYKMAYYVICYGGPEQKPLEMEFPNPINPGYHAI